MWTVWWVAEKWRSVLPAALYMAEPGVPLEADIRLRHLQCTGSIKSHQSSFNFTLQLEPAEVGQVTSQRIIRQATHAKCLPFPSQSCKTVLNSGNSDKMS